MASTTVSMMALPAREKKISWADLDDAASEASTDVTDDRSSGTVELRTDTGEIHEVSRAASEKAARDLRAIILDRGAMTQRTLGQKYTAQQGCNFTKAVGVTLACYLRSDHGAMFIVEDGAGDQVDRKGRVLPFKDMVRLRENEEPKEPEEPEELEPEPEETTAVEEPLQASRRASWDGALLAAADPAVTPTVKNTFLEFLPPRRTTRPRRRTCGARLAEVLQEEEDEEEELETDDDEVSPHEFPAEYDEWPLGTTPVYSAGQLGLVQQPVMTHKPMAPLVGPAQLLMTHAHMAQGLLAAQQEMAALRMQLEAQARQLAGLQQQQGR